MTLGHILDDNENCYLTIAGLFQILSFSLYLFMATWVWGYNEDMPEIQKEKNFLK